MSDALLSESCVILPDAAGLDRLHDLLDRLRSRLAQTRAADLDRARIDSFTLAIGEVVANIARHAYRETAPDERLIAIRLSATATHVRAELEDTGLPFTGSLEESDGNRQAEPMTLPERGRGLPLIRRTVDAVSYERTIDGRNRWVLEQRLVRR
jgi:anti-sigma regulatory factor (Ser/Thr protein kinase)